ncbi:MAG: LamG domain-containing protein [Alphaproteobacteria bacterium]|nr:LamG domain-containing protein [Alphaproteobacteria bacterium]
MALPTAGNGIRAEAQVLPSASLTDFTLLVDLSQIPAARLTHLFNDVNTADGSRGRVSNLSNIELPFDWIGLSNQASPGFIRIKYTGTLPTTGTVGVIIYSPNTRNTAYSVTDTYGRYNAYDIARSYPCNNYLDRCSGSLDLSAIGSPTFVSGIIGDAISLDGANDALSTSMYSTSEYTLNMWLMPSYNSNTEVGYHYIYDTSTDAGRYLIYYEASAHQYWAYFGGVSYGNINLSHAASEEFMLTIVVSASSINIYKNASLIFTDTAASPTSPATFYIGQRNNGTERIETYIDEISIDTKTLDLSWITEEYTQTNNNSTFWGNWSDITISSGYTLDADAGSYLITGSDISLLHNRVLNAESGNYTVNGSDINLSVNRVITAESGSYNIIGADIELSISSELAILAEAGHYEITGSDIDLIVNRVLNAESGSYNITGGDIDLTVVSDKILNAESGNYNITGSDIELKIDRVLNAESGSYSIIGSDVELVWSGQPIAKGLVNISMDMKIQDITMDIKTQTITMELTV